MEKNLAAINEVDLAQIKWCPVPSLQHMSAVKILVALMQLEDVKEYMGDCSYMMPTCYALELFDISFIVKKVTQLPLPKEIKVYVNQHINSVMSNVYSWLLYHDCHVFHAYRYMDDFDSVAIKYCEYMMWDSRGSIDYVETAKVLLRIDALSQKEKYRLACCMCLTEEIEKLGLPMIDSDYVRQMNYYLHPCDYYFTRYLLEKYPQLRETVPDSIGEYPDMLENLGCEEVELVRYLWRGYSRGEKVQNLKRFIKIFRTPKVLEFTLADMSDRRIKQLLENALVDVICCLIYEPLYFDWTKRVLSEVWDVLTAEMYCSLIEMFPYVANVCDNVGLYRQYMCILERIWQNIPAQFMQYVLDDDKGNTVASVLSSCFWWEKNLDLVESVLSQANEWQRKNMIFSNNGLSVCAQLVKSCQWKFFVMFMERSLCCNSCRVYFKRIFIRNYGSHLHWELKTNHKYCCFQKYISWCHESYKERPSEEEYYEYYTIFDR